MAWAFLQTLFPLSVAHGASSNRGYLGFVLYIWMLHLAGFKNLSGVKDAIKLKASSLFKAGSFILKNKNPTVSTNCRV
ncbi:hypothetical protein FLJC2902T_31410 [Flavobacterium limnosediminis JC2902]|uniref:Uncharacterized protein n=1 Tax=Flavobacterium limnosediminis JC2902 TaxID=1341181 RepID=V6SF64_9FLAO|nr:hypothetical protein FLJC2902T_31410 [Flavobacterium limnosediminis JC2902]